MVSRNRFTGGILPDRKDMHGTETGREKEELSCKCHEVSELFQAVQMFTEFQMDKSSWSVISGVS